MQDLQKLIGKKVKIQKHSTLPSSGRSESVSKDEIFIIAKYINNGYYINNLNNVYVGWVYHYECFLISVSELQEQLEKELEVLKIKEFELLQKIQHCKDNKSINLEKNTFIFYESFKNIQEQNNLMCIFEKAKQIANLTKS